MLFGLHMWTQDGRSLWWDGHGWALVHENAREYSIAAAVGTLSTVALTFPSAQIKALPCHPAL